jgi:hypothetical protein
LPLSFLFFEREPKNFEIFERERILLTMNANAQMCERVQKYAHMVYTAICTIDLEQKIIPPIIVENFMKYLSNLKSIRMSKFKEQSGQYTAN